MSLSRPFDVSTVTPLILIGLFMTKTALTTRSLALATLVVAAACTPLEDDRPARLGELGAGTFRYTCVGDSDPFCANGFVADTFPERFAVGGRFNLAFLPDGSDQEVPLVVPGARDSVNSEGMSFRFSRAGYAVFLALESTSTVVDLKHLYGADIASIAVLTDDSQELGMLELEPGEDLDVIAEPRDEQRSTLAGSLDYTWTIDDPETAEVLSIDMDRDITIRGVSDGETTLRIVTDMFEQEVRIVVGTGIASTAGTATGGTEGGTGGGTDGGTDSDTDSGTEGGQ